MLRRNAANVAAALDFVPTAGDAGDGLGVGDVLFDEDAIGKGRGVVGFENEDAALQNDCALVEMVIDKVDRATDDFDAVVEGLLLGVEAGEGRKQRRMNVEDAIRKGCDESRREQTHVAGETDEVDIVLAQTSDKVGVVFGSRAALGNEEGSGKV